MEQGPAIAGLDHLLVGVADLEQARAGWHRLGFLPSPRGRHIGWGTANYCLMFRNGYIELIGVVDPDQVVNGLDRFLEKREGLQRLALACDDLAAAAAALRARGIASGEAQELTRVIEVPGLDTLPAFRLVDLPSEATPGLSAFVIQHLTPELVWRPAWCRHPNGATGLAAVTTVVEEPSALAIPYGELFGFDRVWVRDGGVEVDTGRGRLLFVDPQGLARLHPGLTSYPAHPAPWCAAARLTVERLDATGYFFEQAGVSFRQPRPDRLIIAPAAANGVILEFVQAKPAA